MWKVPWWWCLVSLFGGVALSSAYRRRRRAAGRDELVAFALPRQNCGRSDEPTCELRACSHHNLTRLVSCLDAAEVCVDVCVYTISCHELSNALVRAHRRGVVVRAITDSDMAYNCGSEAFAMKRKGIPVKSNKPIALMHHKFCVIDSAHRVELLRKTERQFVSQRGTPSQLLLTGSLNWTKEAIHKNWENFLITSHAPLIDEFQREFDTLWESFTFIKIFT